MRCCGPWNDHHGMIYKCIIMEKVWGHAHRMLLTVCIKEEKQVQVCRADRIYGEGYLGVAWMP